MKAASTVLTAQAVAPKIVASFFENATS